MNELSREERHLTYMYQAAACSYYYIGITAVPILKGKSAVGEVISIYGLSTLYLRVPGALSLRSQIFARHCSE